MEPPKPPRASVWQDRDGRSWWIIQEVPGFLGVFLAVEVKALDSNEAVHGRTVSVIVHEPTFKAKKEAQDKALAAEERRKAQSNFYSKLASRFRDRWLAVECPKTCSQHQVWSFTVVAHTIPEHDAFLAGFCPGHRALIDESGEPWPPAAKP